MGDYRGDLVYQPYVIYANDTQSGKESKLLLGGPLRFDDPVSVIGHQLGGVGTVGPVDLYAIVYGDESKNVVSGNGVATGRKCVVDLLKVITDEQGLVILFVDFVDQSADMGIELLPVLMLNCFFTEREFLQVLDIDHALRHIVKQVLR